VSFPEVTAAGNTIATEITPMPADPPSGYEAISQCFDIQTTVSYTGLPRILFQYDTAYVGQEDLLRLFWWNGTVWEDVTAGFSTGLRLIYADADMPGTFFLGSSTGNTPAGTNVQVTPATGVYVSFPQVTAAGNTTATEVNPPPAAPPFGYEAISLCFDIQTTAVYTGLPRVLLQYDTAYVAEEDQLRLFQWNGTVWEDVTTGLHADLRLVYADVSDLGIFFLGNPTVNTPVGTDVQVAPATGVWVSFPEVTTAGNTMATETTPMPADPPLDFEAISLCFDIQTTAIYTGLPRISFQYDTAHAAEARQLRLFQWNGTAWNDITVGLDTDLRLVYGDAGNLGIFFLGKSAHNTLVGTNVLVEPAAGVYAKFPEVTVAGNTTATEVNPLPAALPSGYEPIIQTTALYTGLPRVLLQYDTAYVPEEAQIRMFRWSGTVWEDVTTGLTASLRLVYADVDTLGTFILGKPA
jgi:hypothetical protein